MPGIAFVSVNDTNCSMLDGFAKVVVDRIANPVMRHLHESDVKVVEKLNHTGDPAHRDEIN